MHKAGWTLFVQRHVNTFKIPRNSQGYLSGLTPGLSEPRQSPEYSQSGWTYYFNMSKHKICMENLRRPISNSTKIFKTFWGPSPTSKKRLLLLRPVQTYTKIFWTYWSPSTTSERYLIPSETRPNFRKNVLDIMRPALNSTNIFWTFWEPFTTSEKYLRPSETHPNFRKNIQDILRPSFSFKIFLVLVRPIPNSTKICNACWDPSQTSQKYSTPSETRPYFCKNILDILRPDFNFTKFPEPSWTRSQLDKNIKASWDPSPLSQIQSFWEPNFTILFNTFWDPSLFLQK